MNENEPKKTDAELVTKIISIAYENKYSRPVLSEKIGFAEGTLYAYERGRKITPRMRYRIERFIECHKTKM